MQIYELNRPGSLLNRHSACRLVIPRVKEV
jgi:hypothetical protein